AARSHGVRGTHEEIHLLLRETRQPALGAPPADIGIAPDRAQTGARRIHEHAVECGGEGQWSLCGHVDDLHVARAAATDSVAEQAEASAAHVAGDERARVV